MNYSTLIESFQQDADGTIFDFGSLYERLSGLRDSRQRRGRRYELAVILIGLLLAKLAGEDKPEGIADWVQLRSAFFVDIFHLTRAAMPCAMTYRRVLAEAITISELDQLAREYLLSWPRAGQSLQIVLDGKTARGVLAPDQTRAMHLLAAYLPDEGIVLMQLEVGSHTNEIPTAPNVLKVLDLQGKIVTADALLTQRALSKLIVEAGGDYVWTVKDNQPQLRRDIEQLFAPEACLPGTSPVITDKASVQTVEKNRGRIETRCLTTCSLLTESSDWPYLQQVFKLERRRVLGVTGAIQTEIVYGVTSLTAQAANPQRLLELNRGHWGIENGLHYRRDVTLREDAGRTKFKRVGQVIASLNNLIIGLTIGRGWTNLAQARRYYEAHPDLALKLLFQRPSLTL
jgi:predicted transposase YbfD/YdcC